MPGGLETGHLIDTEAAFYSLFFISRLLEVEK
jgi:hypothetical protein